MEVLNKNQRQSAIWRLVGVGFLVLIVNAMILMAIQSAYANQGDGEADAVRREKEKFESSAKGTEQGLKNQIKALQAQMNALKAENASLKTDKADMMNEYKILKTRNDFLEKDLNRCLMSKN